MLVQRVFVTLAVLKALACSKNEDSSNVVPITDTNVENNSSTGTLNPVDQAEGTVPNFNGANTNTSIPLSENIAEPAEPAEPAENIAEPADSAGTSSTGHTTATNAEASEAAASAAEANVTSTTTDNNTSNTTTDNVTKTTEKNAVNATDENTTNASGEKTTTNPNSKSADVNAAKAKPTDVNAAAEGQNSAVKNTEVELKKPENEEESSNLMNYAIIGGCALAVIGIAGFAYANFKGSETDL